ncbi:MAG TPA: acyl-CoA dehydrogenase family protein, partial [Marmoricola sp.]|nr:acyl-CoA dehydrogenase family protein [Marmoricola sp.]
MDESQVLAEEIRSVMVDVLDKGPAEQRGTWSAVAEAGLLAMAAPESFGGSDLGLREVGVLLQEAGRRASDLPLWETLVCGQLTIAAHGSDALVSELLPRLISGDLMISPALAEPGAALSSQPRTHFDGDRLTGHKLGIRRFEGDSLLLVTATGPNGPTVLLVDPSAAGVELQSAPNSRGRDAMTATFNQAPVRAVLDQDAFATVLRNAAAGLVLWGAG